MAKSNEMIRLEIPNRIAQANVQAFKVLVIILARKVKEKNMIAKLYQGGMELCRSAGESKKPADPAGFPAEIAREDTGTA